MRESTAAESGTAAASDPGAYAPAQVEVSRFVSCRLADAWWGVNAVHVREVTHVPRVAFLPSAPVGVAGLANLRGRIALIVDPRGLLGLPATPIEPSSRLLVLDTAGQGVGCLVDEVGPLVCLPAAELEPPLGAHDPGGFVTGTSQQGGRVLAILDVPSLLAAAGVRTSHGRGGEVLQA